MAKRKSILNNTNAVQLRMGKDDVTKEPLVIIKVGVFTEIGLTLDGAAGLEASLRQLRALYLEEHAERVTKAQQAAARGK